MQCLCREQKQWRFWASPQCLNLLILNHQLLLIQTLPDHPWYQCGSPSKCLKQSCVRHHRVPDSMVPVWGTIKFLTVILLSGLFILIDQDISEGFHPHHRGLEFKVLVLHSLSYWTLCSSSDFVILTRHPETSTDPRHSTALPWHLSRSVSTPSSSRWCRKEAPSLHLWDSDRWEGQWAPCGAGTKLLLGSLQSCLCMSTSSSFQCHLHLAIYANTEGETPLCESCWRTRSENAAIQLLVPKLAEASLVQCDPPSLQAGRVLPPPGEMGDFSLGLVFLTWMFSSWLVSSESGIPATWFIAW